MSSRHIQGAKAKAAGRAFEDRINAAFERYRAAGEAVIQKTPEPMRPIKRLGGGRFVAVFEHKAQPDYSGVYHGCAIVMEAKYTSGKRIYQSRVTDQQAKQLDEHEKCGALAFILVGFATGNVYRIPWYVWKNMKNFFGHASASEEELQRMYKQLPVIDGYVAVLEAAYVGGSLCLK